MQLNQIMILVNMGISYIRWECVNIIPNICNKYAFAITMQSYALQNDMEQFGIFTWSAMILGIIFPLYH